MTTIMQRWMMGVTFVASTTLFDIDIFSKMLVFFGPMTIFVCTFAAVGLGLISALAVGLLVEVATRQ